MSQICDKPAAAPGPRCEQRVEQGAAEEAPDHEAAPLPPLCHRSGRDRGDGVHERHHVEEEADERRRDQVTAQRPAAFPQEHPAPRAEQRSADRFGQAERRVAEAAERQGEADEEEADEAEGEDGEVGGHHVGCVLRLAEAGFDEREAGLHEDDQDGADHDPQQVDVLCQRRDGIHLLLREGDGRQERGAGKADAGGGDDSSCTFGHSVLQWNREMGSRVQWHRCRPDCERNLKRLDFSSVAALFPACEWSGDGAAACENLTRGSSRLVRMGAWISPIPPKPTNSAPRSRRG